MDDINATTQVEEPAFYMTKRPTVQAAENLLFKVRPVLDHGKICMVDYMGDDAAVVQAARTSYGRGTRRNNDDEALIRYLMRHHHTTPFEMLEVKYFLSMPIFVARQWIRHRMASINEYSARYSIMEKEFYIPAPEHLAAQSTTNKQGRGAILEGAEAEAVLNLLREDANRNYDHYTEMLNEEDPDPSRQGLSRELARMNLTLNTYTRFMWKTDVHNLMNFLRLRSDLHAQFEIRVYADIMVQDLREWIPMTYRAFVEYRQGAVTLSKTMLDVVKHWCKGETVDQETSGLSKREWTDLQAYFQET